MKKRNLNNLTHQAYQIDRSSYEKRNGHRGIALWFTGLSGSGKSTLANGLHQKLFEI
ncbi:adenylyl-sulfate kinase, partial [Crocinitomicaceae bacterium]|nr:adenylyl-sulfate kinase [Crocinitomicaceae bacterium]